MTGLNQKRNNTSKRSLYGLGYEGMDLSTFINLMSRSNITLVVDVRLNAISRKPGFSKKSLSNALQDSGIEYIHKPELGNPKDNRESFRTGDGIEGKLRMREILNNGSGPALIELVNLAGQHKVAMLCFEREFAKCHRSVIAEMVHEIDSSINLCNIAPNI